MLVKKGVKCSHCGNYYSRLDMLLGVPRCPICFKRVDYRKDSINDDLNYYIKGENKQNKIERCKNCPYEVCIAGTNKNHVFILENYMLIMKIYRLYDKGLSKDKIAIKLKMAEDNVDNYIYRRMVIMNIFNKYNDVEIFTKIKPSEYCPDYNERT